MVKMVTGGDLIILFLSGDDNNNNNNNNNNNIITIIVQVTCKVYQQMIRRDRNLGRISKSEKVSFQMVMERNDAI